MTDEEILEAAVRASNLPDNRFAMEVLGINDRTGRRYKAGERKLDATIRIVCIAIIARPQLARELVQAHELIAMGRV